MSKEHDVHDGDLSDEEHGPSETASRKRSSRACDQCRKTKSKCERFQGDNEPCKSCSLAGVACTFLGPSFKRGPPKGYIHAIEQRWHQVESVLGAILSSPDPQVQKLIVNLRKDDLARDVLTRVDAGPFGPTGRLNHSAAMTKEDFFASILSGSTDTQSSRDPSRPRRQSRMSREIVSSNNSMLVSPTLEWQDRLSTRFAYTDMPAGDVTPDHASSFLSGGQPLTQRRRLERDGLAHPDWDGLYKLETVSGNDPAIGRFETYGNTTTHLESEESDEATSIFGHLSLDENKEVRYHGHTSGLHLLSHADRTDERNVGGVWNLPMARVWPPAVNQFIPEENVNVTLPSLEVQRHLLDLYFIYVHPAFPVVHKTLFWKDFEAALTSDRYTGSNHPEKSHYSNLLLLSMFAIAARYDQEENLPATGNIWEAGLDYMVQAREVLNRVYHYCKGSTCQALLLLGLREFGIGQMEHGWLYIGMALRMAQDLGLHRDAHSWQMNHRSMFSPMELQARKQIWWACNRADKYTAVYMGRPPAISEANFDTPLPDVDADEMWQPHALDPAALNYTPVPGRVMLSFRAGASLITITGTIMDRIYPVRPISHAAKRAALVELEARLDQWFAELPEGLAYDVASKRNIVPPPHILILHIAYWNAVLLLHRAFIPKWRPVSTHHRQGSSSTRESDAVALKSFDICQTAAVHITSIVVAYQNTFGLRRGAFVLTQHMFAAGIMHVVTLTMRPSNVQTSVALQQMLSALKEMGVIWPSARRAYDLLHGAKVHVDKGFLSSFVNAAPRPKRGADAAFGTDKTVNILQKDSLEELEQSQPTTPEAITAPAAAAVADNRILAHMLGIEIPGIEPSTSYLPGYEWWPRPGQSSSPAASQPVSTPSPNSSRSSPPSTMGIPFSFDQTQNFWTEGVTAVNPDFGLNYAVNTAL
ncbi:hypothetical protein BV25DRAFT_1875230 [Artomyces pyxidatus]|uniref:Uncharacterized protein n=1 Tax=Artomyces pyxidatus TaxID=48021 RepID=A0ACB8THX9_9AGAM|nr:hypothetical protein BV25DRAFT_1875230 [Artomyces pyxidatus]